MAGLLKEVWIAGIQENPVPDKSFIMQSTDLSEFVENNTLHLQEAGVEPAIHEDYFNGSETDLPLASVADIPNQATLKTYSTERTRHRDLQEVELSYARRTSLINRHKVSLEKNLGQRAAFSWSPADANSFNKITALGGNDSIIDAIIDLEAFYSSLSKYDNLNLTLTAEHMAKIKKENKNLYKEIIGDGGIYGFKIFRYNNNAIYTSDLVKKSYGAVLDTQSGDKMASFSWCSDEGFRCFGDTEMYETLRSAASQADEISFAQRALVGNIRATTPKYLGAIL